MMLVPTDTDYKIAIIKVQAPAAQTQCLLDGQIIQAGEMVGICLTQETTLTLIAEQPVTPPLPQIILVVLAELPSHTKIFNLILL
jgi:hypothetical protein